MQRNESSSEGEPSSISVHRRPSTHRKISALRLATEPPCAPPPHALPAVPVPCESDVDDDSQTSPSGSGSPSSISFASSASPVPDSYSNEYLDPPYLTLRGRPVITDNESVASRKPTPGDISHSPLAEIFAHVRVSASTCPPSLPEGHSLKKSVSHSTLQRCMVGTWLPSSSSSGDPNSVEKEPRKQRSFHRSRHQTPPAVPLLRHTNSCTPSPSNPLPESPNARRGAPSSPPITVRKRLFSGSSQRRPSTGATEDDLRSVFSLPTEVERNQGSISLHTASLNEDSESEPLPNTSPTSPIEYAQQILSPAEMFAVEAKVQSEFENKYGGMIRNQQPTSPSALTPPLGSSYIKEGFNTAPSAFPRFGTHGFPPTSQNLPVPQSYVRPSTARDSSSLLSLQSGPSVGGLPLPPSRSRIRPHTAEPPYNRLPNINSLEGARMSHVPFVPLSPPPRRTSIRTVVSVESTQKSMIRKPSFLDITDETPSMEDSFLDLGNGKASLDILQVDEYDDDDDLVIYAQ
ncbi:hypothetical protein ID866_6498 [Astraeus odoratus]|nr:hypothetical protein ID866_6498 [Astraeus odoratus]